MRPNDFSTFAGELSRSAWTAREALGPSSLNYRAKLHGNPFHEQPAWAFAKILRTRREPLPAASLRWVSLAEQNDHLFWRFTGELGLPGMPDESLRWWGVRLLEGSDR